PLRPRPRPLFVGGPGPRRAGGQAALPARLRLLRLRRVPRESVVTMSRRVERAQVCVVGTGAAGGILAYRLAEAGRDVLSLEQGDAITADYFTNELRPAQEEYFGIAADRPWPVPPSDSFFYENARANRLYARGDQSSTTPESERVFRNRQVFRLNGKQNLWA